MKRVPRSHQEKTIQQVLEWYDFQSAALGRDRSAALQDISNGTTMGDSRFLGKTAEEVEGLFSAQRQELRLLAVLDLLAAAEARLRLDYLNRVEKRWKDTISRRFQEAHKQLAATSNHRRVRLDEHILETWVQETPAAKRAVGQFRGVMRLRHWLAHGRYWNPRLGRKYSDYSPADVYDIALKLLVGLGIN